MADQDFTSLLTRMQQFAEEAYGLETWLGEDNGFQMLKVGLVQLGKGSGQAVMEICPVPLAPNPDGEVQLVEFYTTVADHIREDNMAPALAALNRMNLRCPVGAFHLFEDQHQMYHKYGAVLPMGEAGTQLATMVFSMVVETVNQLFEDAMAIAADGNSVTE